MANLLEKVKQAGKNVVDAGAKTMLKVRIWKRLQRVGTVESREGGRRYCFLLEGSRCERTFWMQGCPSFFWNATLPYLWRDLSMPSIASAKIGKESKALLEALFV
jgi:hypothetical protein